MEPRDLISPFGKGKESTVRLCCLQTAESLGAKGPTTCSPLALNLKGKDHTSVTSYLPSLW